MKLFIAARIHGQRALAELDHTWERFLEMLPPNTIAERETQPHITLQYLGEIPSCQAVPSQGSQGSLHTLAERLREIALEQETITLELGLLHTFPSILWAGMSGRGRAREDLENLENLQQRIQQAVAQEMVLGERETHPSWIPHITLGRFGQDPGPELWAALREIPEQGGLAPQNENFLLSDLEILDSRRDQDGNREYVPVMPPIPFQPIPAHSRKGRASPT